MFRELVKLVHMTHKTLKKLTIAQAATVLAQHGKQLEPQQPIVVNSAFVTQYRVDGNTYTGQQILEMVQEYVK